MFFLQDFQLLVNNEITFLDILLKKEKLSVNIMTSNYGDIMDESSSIGTETQEADHFLFVLWFRPIAMAA